MIDPDTTRALRRLCVVLFGQMLAATVLSPAVRPFIASQHGGVEGAMHAFMALNMLGAILAAPLVGRLADRLRRPRRLIAALAACDALLLLAMIGPMPTPLLLVLRTLEGAAHVGAATVLTSEAATLARRGPPGRIMGSAGAAILLAVASGHALGGVLLRLDVRAPFLVGAALAASVALWALLARRDETPAESPAPVDPVSIRALALSLAVPLGAAFVSRFAVGALVVTFTLHARQVHGLDDTTIAALYALLTTTFALATRPGGSLADRFGAQPVMILGALFYAIALHALPSASRSALFLWMPLAGLASGPVFAAVLREVARGAPGGARARAMALVHGVGCLGMLLGPAVAGIVSALASRAGVDRSPVFHLAAGAVDAWVLVALFAWRASVRDVRSGRPVELRA